MKAKKVMDTNNAKSQTATPTATAEQLAHLKKDEPGKAPAAKVEAKAEEAKVPAGKRDKEAEKLEIEKLLKARKFAFSKDYTPKGKKGAWVPTIWDDVQRYQMLESGKFTREEIDLVCGDRRHTWLDRTIQWMKEDGLKPVLRK